MEGSNAAVAGRSLGNLSRHGEVAARQSQVLESLVSVGHAVNRFNELVNRLEERLSGALRPTGPTAEGSNKNAPTPREIKAPLADSLDEMQAVAVRAEMRLADILSRLEI